MTATTLEEAILENVRALPAEKQEEVLAFTRSLGANRQLSPEELGALANRLLDARSPEEAAEIRDRLTRGFYGI